MVNFAQAESNIVCHFHVSNFNDPRCRLNCFVSHSNHEILLQRKRLIGGHMRIDVNEDLVEPD